MREVKALFREAEASFVPVPGFQPIDNHSNGCAERTNGIFEASKPLIRGQRVSTGRRHRATANSGARRLSIAHHTLDIISKTHALTLSRLLPAVKRLSLPRRDSSHPGHGRTPIEAR
jgi:hypothetical protein